MQKFELNRSPNSSFDSGIFPTENGEVVAGVRPAGTREVEVRRKLDYGDRLYDLIPDLRSVVATIASE